MRDCALMMGEADLTGACHCCGAAANWPQGPRVVDASTTQPMCRRCGRNRAPDLAALLDLAHIAEDVGRCSRHLLTPPMKSLLELARAAESFATTTPAPRRKTG